MRSLTAAAAVANAPAAHSQTRASQLARSNVDASQEATRCPAIAAQRGRLAHSATERAGELAHEHAANSDAKSPPVAAAHLAGNTPVADTPYESPLKKLKKTMNQYPTQLFTTTDSVRNFIRTNNVKNADVCASVRICARLLWTITDNVLVVDKSGQTTLLHFLRLYLSEEHAPEPLEDQIRDYQEYQRNDAMQTNQYLITTSLYEIDINDSSLPPQGAVIMFTPTKLRLYNNCVQIDTKIHNISVVAMPTPP